MPEDKSSDSAVSTAETAKQPTPADAKQQPSQVKAADADQTNGQSIPEKQRGMHFS